MPDKLGELFNNQIEKMNLSTNQKLLSGFGISFLVLLLSTILSYYNIHNLIKNTDNVKNTKLVLLKLESIIATLKVAEAGHQGFLLSKDSSYIKDYQNAFIKLKGSLEEIKGIKTTNAGFGVITDSLIAMFQPQIQYLEQTGQPPFLNQGKFNKAPLEKAESLINQLKKGEEYNLITNIQNAQFSASYTPFFIFLVSIFGFVIGGTSLFIIKRDLKKQQITEEKLKKSESNLLEAQEIAQLGNWSFDFNTKILDWSPELYRIFGRNPQNHISFEDYNAQIHPEDAEIVNMAVEEAMNTHQPYSVEYRIITLNKEIRYIQELGRITLDAEGNLWKLIGIMQDITERKDTENKLVESRHFIQRLVDQSPDTIYIFDIKEIKYLYISNAISEDLGYASEEIIDLGTEAIHTLTHPEDFNKFYHYINSFSNAADNEIREIEYRVKDKNNNWHYVTARHSVFKRSDEGKPIQIIGVSRDITEKKKAEAEIKAQSTIIEGIVSRLPVTVTKINKTGTIMEAIGSGFQVLGLKDNAYKGKCIHDLYPLEKESLEKIFNQESSQFMSQRGYQNKNYYFQNYYFEDSERQEGIIFGIDVTLQKLAEEEINQKNIKLAQTLKDLEKAKESLIKANAELEERVLKRTHELSVSEERFRMVSMATNDAIWDWDIVNNIIWWNEGFKTMFGYDNIKLIQGIESRYELIHPDDFNRVTQSILHIKESGGKFWKEEFRFLKADGSYALVLDRGYILRDEEGKPYRMIGSMLDITENKKAEIALQEQKELLQNVLTAIPHAVFWKDRNSIFMGCNQNFLTNAGLQHLEELIGKSDYDMPWTKEESDYYVACDKEVMETGNPILNSEEFHTDGRGKKAIVLTSKVPMKNNNGEIIGLLGVFTDITERKEIEEALRRSEEQLRLITDALPVLISYVDSRQRYRFNNKAYEEWYGISRTDLYGMHMKDLLSKEKYAEIKPYIEQALDGEQVEFLTEFTHKGNIEKTVATDFRPHIQEGEVKGFYVLVKDITEQKYTEKALEDAIRQANVKNSELLKINEILDTFVYAAAHDLKTPVTNLKLVASLMNKTTDPEKKANLFSGLDKSINRLENTINGLVQVIEIQNDQQVAIKQQSFREILDSIQIEYNSVLEEYIGSIDADFSECPSIVYIEAYIFSIMKNLVSNAIKYCSDQNEIRIQVKTRREDGYILLTVKDNGIGMDLERYGKNLFKPFTRFTKKADGKGIGLHLIKTMIEKNGGKVEVESALNVGTTFKCYLKEYVNEGLQSFTDR
jgi:PAS domain S-box-containing protein